MKKHIQYTIILALILTIGCTEKPIGGERDEHGCLGPAGYTWNEDIGACIREWELDESQRKAAKIAVASLSYRPITITKVEILRCPGCFKVYIRRGDTDEDVKINLADWKILTNAPEELEINSFEDCINAGNPVMESYPRQCRAGDKTFVEEIEETEKLTLEEAIEIVQESECLEKGSLTDNSFYNENTKTWWIDLEMKEEFKKDYCYPACVINEKTKTAEINWRCTGALPP